MQKGSKRLIFYISIALFLFISYGTVLFALGYEYDFIQNKFIKTGSFQVIPNVSAEVYINDQLVGRSSFLSNSYSKSRLLPKTYKVRVQKENYQSWQKLIKIEAGFLSDFSRVALIPETFKENLVASSSVAGITVRRFDEKTNTAIIGNAKKLEAINLENGSKEILKTTDPRYKAPTVASGTMLLSPDQEKNAWSTGYEIWAKWTMDSSYQPFHKANERHLVTRFSQRIGDLAWYKDSNHVIASTGGVIKFIELDDRGSINIFDITTIAGPFYYSQDQDAIFKFDGNKLIKINLGK